MRSRLSRLGLSLVLRLWSALWRPLPAVKPAPLPWFFSREGLKYYCAFWTRDWLRRYGPGAVVLLPVLVVVFLVHWKGMLGYPGYLNNDEGIYMEQAYAVQFLHRVTPYTYNYDHPDGAWAQIAGYMWSTFAYHRYPTTIDAGRECMLVVHMIASTFLYLLARRIGFRRLAAGAAVLLFSLSPLGLLYQRVVFIDNLAVMWTIIAMWFLASHWRSTYSAGLGGVAFAFALLSKETVIVLLPAVWLMRFDRRDRRNTRMCGVFFWVALTVTPLILYIAYAAIKGEIVPGPGHVSWWGSVLYQLHNRTGTGSLLNTHSGTYQAAIGWLHSDPYLLGVGVVASALAMFSKRQRAVAFALIVQILAMCRNGYLPFAYATALFPFAALSIAGVADWLCTGLILPGKVTDWNRLSRVVSRTTQIIILTAIALAIAVVSNSWQPQLATAMSAPPNNAAAEAANYIARHIAVDGKTVKLITVDDAWTDLYRKNLPGLHVISEYKADLDPAVHQKELPNGWRSVDYLLLGGSQRDSSANLFGLNLVTVAQARSHAVPIASFGNRTLILWKVVKMSKGPNG